MPIAQQARKNMVDCQIHTNKVESEQVLAALQSTPREDFVPDRFHGVAYLDEDLPIGEGRYLMEPMVFAKLLQLADINDSQKVLVIGAGTGYAVAVIAQLAREVIGLEDNINLISAAQANLKKLGINNASFVKAELTEGADRQKPYDLIFINGAVEEIPAAIYAQLKDNGHIITVKADENNEHAPYFGVAIHKTGKINSEIKKFQAFTNKLPGFEKKRGFDF